MQPSFLLCHACANRLLPGLVRVGACFAGKGWGRAAKPPGRGQPCQSVTFDDTCNKLCLPADNPLSGA